MTQEQIWAPWRLAYVQSAVQNGVAQPKPDPRPLDFLPGADPNCFLCQSVADSADQQRGVVHRAPHCIVVLNRYPYNNGHLLIGPRRHVGRLDELCAAEQTEISQVMTQMVTTLEKVLKAQGFNIGLNLGKVAGAGLPGHLHWHVVPRWFGDTNFMPLLANVNVIPQSLEALWKALHEAL